MPRNPKRHLLLQYTASITTSITAIGFISAYSWPSPALPHLTGENSEFPVTKAQGAWIASLYPLGLIIGYLLNPLFIDRIGRKKTLILFCLPQIASWLIIIFAKNYINLYIARIVGGIGYGGGISSSTVYVSEIGDVKNRGVFLVFLRCMMNVGFLFTMMLGAFLNYKNMNFALLLMPLIFFIIFVFMPDSSYFREINEKKEEEVMIKLNSLIEEEEKKKLNLIKEKECETNNCSNSKIEVKNFKNKPTAADNLIKNTDETRNSTNWRHKLKRNILWKLFALPNHRRSLEITLYMGLTNILCGHAGITTFTQQIFTYEGSFLPPEKATVVMATSTAIFSIISTQLVERINRKFILLWTGIIATISLALAGLFFFLKENNMDVTFLQWLPLVGITMYDMMLSSGMGNLFYIYQGELFASEIKSEAIAFNKIFYMAFSFIFLLQFQNYIDAVGTYISFWTFSFGVILGTFGVYVLTPETKGKSLQEIQNLLKSKKIFL